MYYLAVCPEICCEKAPSRYGGKEKTLLKWSNILQLQEQGREKV